MLSAFCKFLIPLAILSTFSVAAETNAWLTEHFLNADSKPPMSFVYGTESSEILLKSWTRKVASKPLDSARTEHSITWTDPTTALQVRVAAVEFANSAVVEWVTYFTNGGKSDTPILEDVLPLSTSIAVQGSRVPTVLYSRGTGGMDTYSLQKRTLNQLEAFRISNESGGKTIDTIPFFDILMEGRGVIGAVGWPGHWQISFSRPSETEISVSAGMQDTHLSLKPGEQIRTPLILLQPWQGDDIDAHNVLRRHVLQYHTPQYDGKPVVVPISHLGWGGIKTSTSLKLIDQITQASIGFEAFWMDAGWYGADRPVDEFQVFGREDWFLHAGNWRVNKIPHPNGLKPISDAAHAKGMKYLLWFEPERAVKGTPLITQHPEWFLGEETVNFGGDVKRPVVKFSLFNFGNPDAERFMATWMSDFITEQGIDIYRQDCNFALAPFWKQADTRDRQGITETRYAEGLLKFWDDLRAKHPNLIIDIVQRGDLETIARGIDLSRADYPVSPDADPIGNQVSTQGLAYWRPDSATLLQVRPGDDYHFRSGFGPGMAYALFNASGYPNQTGKFMAPDFPVDWLRNATAQLKRARPYYYSDFYPISPCSSASTCKLGGGNERSAAFEWAAWQFNRPENGDGMVEAFRREKSDEVSKPLRLRGLDANAQYEISEIDGGTAIRVSGKKMMDEGLGVTIIRQPGASIILYKKVK
jgi:alpha-galactosidase